MIGLSGSLFTSATGAKFQFTPFARSSPAVIVAARWTAATGSGVAARPIWLVNTVMPLATRTTEPPSWSSARKSGGIFASAAMRCRSAQIRASAVAFGAFSARSTIPPTPRARIISSTALVTDEPWNAMAMACPARCSTLSDAMSFAMRVGSGAGAAQAASVAAAPPRNPRRFKSGPASVPWAFARRRGRPRAPRAKVGRRCT